MPRAKPADLVVTSMIGPEYVTRWTGLDSHALHAAVAAGTFPAPISLHGQAVWNYTAVREWIAEQVSRGLMREPPLPPAMRELIDLLAEQCVQRYLAEQRQDLSK